MSFFNSEIVRKEAQEISLKQQEILNRMPFIPMMDTDDRVNFFDSMIDLIDRQKIFYMRLNLSDDPMALEMKEQFRKSAMMLGMDMRKTSMMEIYDGFKKNMENLRQQVLDGDL